MSLKILSLPSKGKSMKKQLLLASLLSALTLPAMAQGFYILGDIGKSNLEYPAYDDIALDESDTAFSFGVGVDLNQFLAIEVAYRDFGSGQDSGIASDDFGDYDWTDTLSASALQGSVVGKLPVNDSFDVFGRLGFANIEVDYDTNDGGFRSSESNSKTKGFFGVGASYNFTPEFALRTEYSQYAEWDDLKLSVLTVGATYHF
jgi:OmpA-OmpF porin, OOP family